MPATGLVILAGASEQEDVTPLQKVHKLLEGVNVYHQVSLANTLARFMGVSFAGHVVRYKDHCVPVPLPHYICPMFGPFNGTFVGDFLKSFADVCEYFACHDAHEEQQQLLLIPIHSNGGNTELLDSILMEIATLRTKKIKTGPKKGQPKVLIVSYAMGEVASCAAILASVADVALASADARLLFHEPMICRQVAAPPNGAAMIRTSKEESDKQKAQLEEIEDRLYQTAEMFILLRFARNCAYCGEEDYQKCKQHLQAREEGSTAHALEWLRQLWYKQCTQTGALQAFLSSCRDANGYKIPLEMPQELAHKTIIAYLTEDIAQDRHTKNITGHWCQRLGLIESTGVDIEFSKSEGIEITPNAYAAANLELGI